MNSPQDIPIGFASGCGAIDPTLSLARAVIVAEHIYERACAEQNDNLRYEALLLIAHLRAARIFAS